MNGLVVLIVFAAGYLAGVLTVLYNDSPTQAELDALDEWDGTR